MCTQPEKERDFPQKSKGDFVCGVHGRVNLYKCMGGMGDAKQLH